MTKPIHIMNVLMCVRGGEVVCVGGGDAVGPLSQARKINPLLYIFLKPFGVFYNILHFKHCTTRKEQGFTTSGGREGPWGVGGRCQYQSN